MPSQKYIDEWKGNKLFDEGIPHMRGCLINAKTIEALKDENIRKDAIILALETRLNIIEKQIAEFKTAFGL